MTQLEKLIAIGAVIGAFGLGVVAGYGMATLKQAINKTLESLR